MSGGIITGGWPFVWAAYAVTATVFTVYTISIIMRLRDEQARLNRDDRSSQETHS